MNVCQQSVQLAWMARHRPEVLARAATAFHCKDWLYFKLTDARATDPSEANFTFGNYKSRTYQSDILDALGAGEAKRLLPPIVEGTAVSHRLSAEAASLTGLKAGTPVALGYVDVICTGLGGGLFDATGKSGCTIVGSTGMHMKLVADPAQVRLNTERSGYTMAFPAPDKVAQIQSNMASTLNIDWLIDMGRGLMADHGLQKSRADMLAGLDQHISAAQPARLLFHPYISLAGERGPFMEPAARAMLTGLEIGVGYHDLMRAVFEGLAFAARDCYATMGDIPTEVRLTGGASRSAQLRLIHASVLNAPVRTVTREEAGAAGAAMMAAVQQQLYPDMQACAAQWVDPWLGPSTRPDTALAEIYDRAFPIYRATRVAMRPQWQAHHALKRTVQ